MPKFSDIDFKFMQMALTLAKNAKGTTFPNPTVGAVIVKNNTIVGKGVTQVCGKDHAEVVALKQAGALAKNATMYVTLEPCNHFGRTPPCTDAIIKAGLVKVIISVKDANPMVCGKGIKKLRQNGITVYTGLLKEDAQKVNEDFFWSVQNHRPWITVKLAMTIDGRIADKNNNSKWITSDTSRKLVHELRSSHASIAIGSGTLMKDDPMLNVRHINGISPTRIIFTSSIENVIGSRIDKTSKKIKTIVVLPGQGTNKIKSAGENLHLWYTGKGNKLARMNRFLEIAHKENITSIFIEGGSKLASFMLENNLVNRLYVFYGNCLLGDGLNGINFTAGLSISSPMRLNDFTIIPLGNNLAITGIPVIGE